MPAEIAQKKNPEQNKGAQRRLRILSVILICFMSWAVFTFIAQWSKLHAKAAEIGLLEQQLEQAKQLNEQTKREIVRLNDREYVEQKIRKELHWSKPGETVFTTPKANP
jgi:cell division protein DivIC